MTNPQARAFWVTGAGRGEIRGEQIEGPGQGEVLVRALYSGVSRGTEALVFRGEVPASQYRSMRAPRQAGNFPSPVKYGYVNVGRVELGPESLAGRPVFCLYPHQDRYVVPADDVYPLPDDVPPERAVLAAYMETAVNGLWDAAPGIGDRVAVVGAGALGCLIAWLASRIPGCRPELIDVNRDRSAIADALGVAFAAPEAAAGDADIVLHTSATETGLATALRLAGVEASIVELSWFGDRRPAIPLGESFHSRRLSIRSSQVGAVPPGRRARWSRARRMELALELLDDPALDVLITGESAFEELPSTMARLADDPAGTLCHRIVYED